LAPLNIPKVTGFNGGGNRRVWRGYLIFIDNMTEVSYNIVKKLNKGQKIFELI